MLRSALRLARPRRRAALLAAAAAACVGAAVVSMAACLTSPPGDLPTLPLHRPTILHDAVQPPTDQVLTELPIEFVVPVVLEDPNEFFEWDVFVNYPDNGTEPQIGPNFQPPTPGTLDGGVFLQTFGPLSQDKIPDPTACNRIEFIVAHQFNQASPHTPDSTGGDIVTWLYSTGGAAACVASYDAGDGAFPDTGSTTDGPPIVPEGGGGDP